MLAKSFGEDLRVLRGMGMMPTGAAAQDQIRNFLHDRADAAVRAVDAGEEAQTAAFLYAAMELGAHDGRDSRLPSTEALLGGLGFLTEQDARLLLGVANEVRQRMTVDRITPRGRLVEDAVASATKTANEIKDKTRVENLRVGIAAWASGATFTEPDGYPNNSYLEARVRDIATSTAAAAGATPHEGGEFAGHDIVGTVTAEQVDLLGEADPTSPEVARICKAMGGVVLGENLVVEAEVGGAKEYYSLKPTDLGTRIRERTAPPTTPDQPVAA